MIPGRSAPTRPTPNTCATVHPTVAHNVAETSAIPRSRQAKGPPQRQPRTSSAPTKFPLHRRSVKTRPMAFDLRFIRAQKPIESKRCSVTWARPWLGATWSSQQFAFPLFGGGNLCNGPAVRCEHDTRTLMRNVPIAYRLVGGDCHIGIRPGKGTDRCSYPSSPGKRRSISIRQSLSARTRRGEGHSCYLTFRRGRARSPCRPRTSSRRRYR